MADVLEYRAFPADVEVRETRTQWEFRGYAAMFDAEAHGEVVRPTAFDRSLARGDDVRLLVNHDGVPLARTKSGTLSLAKDGVGLVAEAKLDKGNPTVRELASAMSRGDMDQMSFGFVAREDPTIDGVRELRHVDLMDVSVVTFPWYQSTSAELNSLDRALCELRAGRRLTAEQRDLIIVAVGDVELDGSTLSDTGSANTENETESEGECCPSCGADCPPGASFCPDCGASMAAAADPSMASAPRSRLLIARTLLAVRRAA